MLDRFNRNITYLRISVTDRCNLRCTYCMPDKCPQFIKKHSILSFEKITDIVRHARLLGISKVRLTGGEPLVRREISKLVRMIAVIPGITDLSMTTNGILLKKYTASLADAGLNRVNVSLDTADPEKYRAITGGGNFSAVESGIQAALTVGLTPLKINCVINKTPDEPDAESVREFAESHGAEVRFIRRMDLRNGRFWQVIGGEGGKCTSCNRIRISCDGKVYPCLFSNVYYGIEEYGMENALKNAIYGKPESGDRRDISNFNIIGG